MNHIIERMCTFFDRRERDGQKTWTVFDRRRKITVTSSMRNMMRVAMLESKFSLLAVKNGCVVSNHGI